MNIDEMNDTTGVNEETEEKRESRFSSFIDTYLIDIIKIVILVLLMVGLIGALVKCLDILGEGISYTLKESASVTAGIITDKEIINGHTKSGGGIGYYGGKVGYNFNGSESYVPTVYRIHISAEFEYDGKTHQGSNYFDVSEDVYNSYNVGDYFDSKNLLGYSNED